MVINYNAKGEIIKEVRVETSEKMIKDFKEQYNNLNKRIKNGEEYIKTCNTGMVDKATSKLELLMLQANTILNKINDAGVEITTEEVLHGFII